MSLIHRLLIFVLLVAVVGITSLWIIGGKKHEFSTQLTINASPDQIFPFLTKPVHLKQWVNGLEHVEELTEPEDSDLPGPPQITERVLKDAEGNPVRFEDQIIRYSAQKSLSVQSSNPDVVVTSIYRLEPAGGATELIYRVKKSNVGWGRFLAPLKPTATQVQMESDARRLKELVESSVPVNNQLPNASALESQLFGEQETASTSAD